MPLQPPEHPEGVRCNVPISAGIMSFPCSLAQGHLAHGEPHYAVESLASVKVWQNWKQDQMAAEAARPAPTMDDVNAAHARAAGFDPATLGQPVEPSVSHDDSPQRCAQWHGDKRCVMEPGHRTRHVSGTTHWSDHETTRVENEPVRLADGTLIVSDDEMDIGVVQREPTKQRPGDQALPSGGQECVQDLVIWQMQESKRVGVERYGSTLMTFNGRRGIQDLFEESRDLFVYLTQVKREAEADHAVLVAQVSNHLHAKVGALFQGETSTNVAIELAEGIVDLIQSWVVAQRQMAPTPAYVFEILRGWSEGGDNLDFKGEPVPADVQAYITRIQAAGE